jgi:hypothetical protein
VSALLQATVQKGVKKRAEEQRASASAPSAEMIVNASAAPEVQAEMRRAVEKYSMAVKNKRQHALMPAAA